MKHTMLTRLGAAGLAAATITTGLAFGPAAANAAEPTAAASSTFKLVWKQNATSYIALTDVWGNAGKAYSTQAEAEAAAVTVTGTRLANGWFSIRDAAASTCYSATKANNLNWYKEANVGNCDYTNPENQFKLIDGVLRTAKDTTIAVSGLDTSTVGQSYPAMTAGTGIPLVTDASALNALTATVDSVDKSARTAEVSGYAVPGSTVEINGQFDVQADAVTGAWSATVEGLKIGANPITVEQYLPGDETPTDELTITATISVAALSATGTFDADIAEKAIVSGQAEPNSTVQILAGGAVVASTTASAAGSYSAAITAPNAGGVYTVHVKQVIDGESNGDVQVDLNYGAAVSITKPVGDWVHNGGDLDFAGKGTPGATVTIREQGKLGVLGTATVLASGNWSTTLHDIAARKFVFEATQESKGANTTKSTVTINPDGTATAPVVNPIAAGDNVLIGTGTPGATIIVRDEDGNEIGRDTVDEDGNWSVTVPPTLGPGKHDLDIVEIVDGDESDATDVTVDFGAAVSATTAVANDKGIVTYTGTGQAGATVQVKGKSGRPLTDPVTVGTDGKWTAVSTVALQADKYTVDVFQTTGIGVKSSAEISFEVKNTTPVAKAVTFTGPAANSTVNNPKPEFSGQGEPGATVIVRGSVRTVATTTVKGDGTWSVRSDIALDNGAYALVAVQTPTNGAPQSSATNPFVIQYKAADKLQVITPAADSTVAGPRPTFTGKGDAGATVTIKGATRTVATAVVQNDGTWTATSTIDLAKDVYNLTVTQDALNGDMEQTTVKFTVK